MADGGGRWKSVVFNDSGIEEFERIHPDPKFPWHDHIFEYSELQQAWFPQDETTLR
jgi:hypothetical protein